MSVFFSHFAQQCTEVTDSRAAPDRADQNGFLACGSRFGWFVGSQQRHVYSVTGLCLSDDSATSGSITTCTFARSSAFTRPITRPSSRLFRSRVASRLNILRRSTMQPIANQTLVITPTTKLITIPVYQK